MLFSSLDPDAAVLDTPYPCYVLESTLVGLGTFQYGGCVFSIQEEETISFRSLHGVVSAA